MANLYFHLPFCRKKCPYCHFYVLPDKEDLKNLFMGALAQEWTLIQKLYNPKPPSSIYFGGGTPTRMGPYAIETILSWITTSPSCEITLEANPEDVDLQTMQAYARLGINRISLGVQSLDNTLLNTLGRTHTAQKTIDSILTIHKAGIQNISIDLMYDVPDQTYISWENTLKQIEKLPITHLSLYNLTIEPHTSFFKHKKRLTPKLPSQELSTGMLHTAISMLESFGLHRYEISAFAKPGYQAQHNTGYWTARPFLGLGPSAHSYLDGKRMANISHLGKYARSIHSGFLLREFEETLSYPASFNELLAVQLRLIEGIDMHLFESLHGPMPTETAKAISLCIKEGYLVHEQKLRLTEKGLLFYDTVAENLI